jgi:hypothetical protein
VELGISASQKLKLVDLETQRCELMKILQNDAGMPSIGCPNY